MSVMFSRDHIRTLQLTFHFPREEKTDIVKAVMELPLNFFKFKKSGLGSTILNLFDEIPTLSYTREFIGVFLSKSKLNFGLGLPPPRTEELSVTIQIPSKDQRSKIKKVFSPSNLGKASIELNFLLGKIFMFLDRKNEIKGSGEIHLVKKTDKKVDFTNILAKDTCTQLKGGILTGIAFDFSEKDFVSSLTMRTSDKKIRAKVGFTFSPKKPIDIQNLVARILKHLNDKLKMMGAK